MSMEIWGCQCLKCIKIFSLPKLVEIKVHNNDLERFELEESNLHYLCITEKHISEFNLLPLKNLKKLCEYLDSTESCVHVFQFYVFQFFFVFFLRVNSNLTWVCCAGDKNHYSHTVHHYS